MSGHADFDQIIYDQLKLKYSSFLLPSNSLKTHRRPSNKAYVLKCGLETPLWPGKSTPGSRLGYSSSGYDFVPSSNSRQDVPRDSTPVGLSAMLSTQFNSKANLKSIPLFSVKTPENQEFSKHLLTERISSVSTFTTSVDSELHLSLNDALMNSVLKNDTTNANYKVQNLQPDEKYNPFINFKSLSKDEQSYYSDCLKGINEVAIALVYSDMTTHIGSYSSCSSNGKVTVSGVGIVFAENVLPPTFFEIVSRGTNNIKVLEFLLQLLGDSSILKVSFDIYQLYIVCSILLCQFKKKIKNMIDLKIASWMLHSDNVAQTAEQLHDTYNLPGSLSCVNQGFYVSFHSKLELLLTLKTHVYKALNEEKLMNLFLYLESPLVDIISEMGQSGITIDKERQQLLSSALTSKLKEIEKEASKHVKKPVNISSTMQLRELLYEELKLDKMIADPIAETAVNREKSTSESCLLKLLDLHPLPKLILIYRRLSKIKSTYVDGISQYMKYGKLYPSWDQSSAATGRLTSFNPNIQAFPKELASGGDIITDSISVRDMIIPAAKFMFVSVDFCSIEMRILAHFSKDIELIEIFNGDSDIFIALTASWKNLRAEQVTVQDRNTTKRVCYGIIYGIGVPKLAQLLNITLHEASVLLKSFLNRFQNIQKFTNAVINRARGTRKLRTILNRLRHFPEINSSNFHVRKSIERQAVNFVIQGSAADICKVSMLKLSEQLQKNPNINAKLLIQIHDELLYEVYEESVGAFCNLIYNTLESSEFVKEVHLGVPLKVKVKVGKAWGSIVDFKSPRT